MKKDFTGFVLAGGKSSRMGADKAFLEIGGGTFLERAADALAPNCASVRIILNNAQRNFREKIPAKFECIFDFFENRGALGGIHAALKNCETEFAVILAVDLPFVSNEAIKNLTEIPLAAKEFAAIVPHQTDGKLQPLCAVYRTNECLPAVEKLLEKTDSASVRDFLKTIPAKIIAADFLSKSENLFFNINLPSDFENLSNFLKTRTSNAKP